MVGTIVTTRIRGTLRVPAGVHLMLHDVVLQFDDTRARWGSGYTATNNLPSRILVEPGGYLDATNCTFTTISGASSDCMWDGIAVLGEPTAPQTETDQGTVWLEDCVIERARAGLLAGTPSYSSGGELQVGSPNGGGGALVQVRYTDFLNCHTGALLRPNGSLRNGSYFRNCLFRADTPLNDPIYTTAGFRYGTQAGIAVYENRGIVIRRASLNYSMVRPPSATRLLPPTCAGRA